MRTWTVDSFEFDESSEEGLAVAFAKRDEFFFPDVEAFVGAAVGVEAAGHLPQPKPFDEQSPWSDVRTYLAHFCSIEIPSPCDWPTYRLGYDPDEWNIVICAPDSFILYSWHSSA